MAPKTRAVFGTYSDQQEAEQAVDALRAAGFRNGDVSAWLPSNVVSRDSGRATPGGVLGGALGWLAGIGALAVPGAGPLTAAGPIMGALAGAGGLSGALVDMGIPEREAIRYEGRVREGDVLLSVLCDNSDWVKRAKELLRRNRAQEVSSTGQAGAEHTGGNRSGARIKDRGGNSPR